MIFAFCQHSKIAFWRKILVGHAIHVFAIEMFFFSIHQTSNQKYEKSQQKKMNVSGGNFSMPASLLLLIERARDTSAIRHSFGSSKNAGRNIGQCVLWLWWTILSIDLAAHIGVV